jgi:hypothetical protein
VTVKTGKQWNIYWCFKKSDGHIANSLLLVGINLSVLPFRSDQDKFSVGAERNGKLMDTLPIAHSLWA